MSQPHKGESGQIVLVTLLMLTVATTIVLSLIGRSTTDVSISNQIEESTRAFNAAEAGIEEALKTGAGTAGAQVLTAGLTYDVVKADIGGAAGTYVFPKKVSRGSSETLWLVNHNPNGTLAETPTYTAASINVCWSSETVTPAMIVSVLYKTAGGQYRVARGAYDPDAVRRTTNEFAGGVAASGCGAGTGTAYRRTVTFGSFTPAINNAIDNPAIDTLLMLRLQPVYADARLAINASGALPLQGSRLESTGASETGITRKIVVYQQYRSPPSIFDNVIYSQGLFGH